MLLNVAAHKVSIRNIKVSKCEHHIMYSVKKRTASQNVKCTLPKWYKTFCKGIHLVTLCVTLTFWKLYVLELLRCVQLRFVTLRHVTVTLCCFTLCSNIVKTSTPAQREDREVAIMVVLTDSGMGTVVKRLPMTAKKCSSFYYGFPKHETIIKIRDTN